MKLKWSFVSWNWLLPDNIGRILSGFDFNFVAKYKTYITSKLFIINYLITFLSEMQMNEQKAYESQMPLKKTHVVKGLSKI